MKGMVFTELMDMVEATFGPEVLEDMIDGAQLSHGGAYTAVGSYPHDEIVRLVQSLSQRTGIPVPDLVKAFGCYMFGRFHEMYGRFFCNVHHAFDFLSSVEVYVHQEVRKLYPDAELPTFETRQPGPGQLVMVYRSKRGFGDLAEGLILGAIQHFDEKIELTREDFTDEHGKATRFTLQQH
jgi:hypothetical protein